MEYIYNNIGEKFDIIVNNYDVEKEEHIYNFLNNFHFLKNKHIFSKKGHLPELWLNSIYNSKITNYDYIMFILDDEIFAFVPTYPLFCASRKHIEPTHATPTSNPVVSSTIIVTHEVVTV